MDGLEDISDGSSEEWGDLLENCNDLVQSVSPEGRFLYVNRGWLETLGYTRDEVARLPLFDVVHPECVAHCGEAFAKVMTGGVVDRVEAVFVAKNGEAIAVEGSVNCRFIDGTPVSTRGIFRDIRERKAAEEALQRSELRLKTIMDSVQDGVVVVDAQTHELVDANDVALQMIGAPREQVVGGVCHRFICPFEDGGCPVTDRQEEIDRSERALRTAKGEIVPVIKTVATVRLGDRDYMIESFVNISERKQMEERLRYLSWHDPLTGVYNRRRFEDEMKRVDDAGLQRVALVVCDLDDFKLVNDTRGHEAGDRLLTDTARLLKSCLREGDFAARIGGDEFAMIVRQGDEGVVESVSRRIGEAVRRYNEKNGAALSLSVGHALLHEGRSRTRDLFKAADADMYRNKLTHKASRNLSPLGGTALGARWG